MLRLLRLPCALLALLLSALGGARLAAYERHDDGLGKTPIVRPAPAAAALPDVPMPVPGPPPALPVVVQAGAASPLEVNDLPDCRSMPAPCRRCGSAGGPRAP